MSLLDYEILIGKDQQLNDFMPWKLWIHEILKKIGYVVCVI